MNLSQIEVFLVLCDELHFGRTAERLRLSQSRVSRLTASFEREVGGALFERTSRRVRLTPLGVRLRAGLAPAHAALYDALGDARTSARDAAGLLRVGFTSTTAEKVTPLVDAFEARHQDCGVELHEVSVVDPYSPLRRGQVDVLVNWFPVEEPDLTEGPVVDRLDRVLAVAVAHPLAGRTSLSIEELADYEVRASPAGVPRAMYEALIPVRTPSGRPIPRADMTEFLSVHEIVTEIARGDIVHPTVAIAPFRGHPGIALIPMPDLPPLRLGLIWCTAHENARIRAFAGVVG